MGVAAALALVDQPNITAEEIVRKAMKIAGDICVYTNHNVTCEILPKHELAVQSNTNISSNPMLSNNDNNHS